ncbi:MAG: TetR/AcrR family transcriptional regulator [Deltaproteobacteria bacterium]|nr:TetR/AcrR family transcriptional regulator [Deltaproteobacteria bacterium]
MARKSVPTRRSRLVAARQRMYRQLVFESAEQLFARKGFDDTTMQEIAAEAGMSLKTLYATVPGKRELHEEVLEVRGRQFMEATAQGIEEGDSALQALNHGVRAYVHFLVENEEYLRIHLREARAWSLPQPGAGELDREQGEALFTSVIKAGIEQGAFYEGDAHTMALTGMAVMQAHLARVAEGIHDVATEALADEVLISLRRLLCRPEAQTAR